MTVTHPPTDTATPLADLLHQLEQDARKEARRLEHQRRLAAGFTDTYYPPTQAEQREQRLLNAALLLADGPDTFCALSAGQPVPRHRLRTEYMDVLARWPRQ